MTNKPDNDLSYNLGKGLTHRRPAGKGTKPMPGLPTWKNLGYVDMKSVPEAKAPKLLPKARDEDAAQQIANVLGMGEQQSVNLNTPAGRFVVRHRQLDHVVEKREQTRERYAHYLRETIENPDEIWLVQHKDGGFRSRYIKCFQGKYGGLVVGAGRIGLITFVAPDSINYINNKRIGIRTYCNKIIQDLEKE